MVPVKIRSGLWKHIKHFSTKQKNGKKTAEDIDALLLNLKERNEELGRLTDRMLSEMEKVNRFIGNF